MLPVSAFGGEVQQEKPEFFASPLDIGKDIVDGLIKRTDMEEQIRLFVDLTSVRGILLDLYIAVYTRKEIIQPGFCVEKAHGRYIKSFFC